MKTVTNTQTRSSLFTILIFLGVPLALIAVLSPLVFIIGDKGMGSMYRLIWGILAFVFIVYFAMKQVSPKKKE